MKSGIYRIINLVNNKMYIGSAKDLIERKCNHFSELRNNKHHSIHLQRAYNKLENKKVLNFEILEYCNENILIERENYYLNHYCKSTDYLNNKNKEFLKLSYNILALAQKGFSGKHKPETIEKFKMNNPLRKDISIYDSFGKFIEILPSAKAVQDKYNIAKTSILKTCNTKKYVCKKENILVGFSNDLDFINFINTSSKPIVFKTWNEGRILSKLERGGIGNPTKIIVTNLKTNDFFIFDSQKEVCNYFKLQPCTVNICLKKNKPYRKYLLFNYKDIV